MAARFELTILQKANGETLSKQIELDAAGKIHNDSSACSLSRGSAERFGFETAAELATAIATCPTHQAFALGRLRDGIPDKVDVVTKRDLNGTATGIIARTLDYFEFLPGVPAWVMLDFDRKGMPTTVSNRITELGGLEAALLSVLPELDKTMRVYRRSTSAELRRVDTGERFDGIGGVHVYVAVCDGSDIPRFLKTLHERCWLTGLGWGMLDVAGRFLERALIDRTVGSPERLQFEGQARLDWPLEQDAASRQPWVGDGGLLDTTATCPSVTYGEREQFNRLKGAEITRLKPEAARARESYITSRSQALAEAQGITISEARKVIAKQCDGTLLPALILPFDDAEFAGCTVADVLADPERFHEAPLADPIEGVTYGRDKAKVYVNAAGSIVIHSFAHGGINYRLTYDYQTAMAVVQNTPDKTVAVRVLKDCDRADELSNIGKDDLRNLTAQTHKIRLRTLDKELKAARIEAAKAEQEKARETQDEYAAGRDVSYLPRFNAEWLPMIQNIDGVLCARALPFPPLRDLEHDPVEVTSEDPGDIDDGAHLLTSESEENDLHG